MITFHGNHDGKNCGIFNRGKFILLVLSVLIPAVSGTLGCGPSRPSGMPSLYPCNIQITQESNALSDATVILMNADGTAGEWAIAGKTDSNGTACCRTHGQFSGVPAGEYLVVVSKDEVQREEKTTPHGRDGLVLPPATTWYLVDPIYRDPTKSPLKVTVEKKQNSFTFDVGKAIRVKAPKRDPRKI